jgi:hypothetical protein
MENLYRLALQGLSYIEPAGVNDYVTIKSRDFAAIIHPDEFAVENLSTEDRNSSAFQ